MKNVGCSYSGCSQNVSEIIVSVIGFPIAKEFFFCKCEGRKFAVHFARIFVLLLAFAVFFHHFVKMTFTVAVHFWLVFVDAVFFGDLLFIHLVIQIQNHFKSGLDQKCRTKKYGDDSGHR